MKRKVEAIRETGAAGVPTDNNRLFNIRQEYGALIPAPDGGAIWTVDVAIGEWRQCFARNTLAAGYDYNLSRRTDVYTAILADRATGVSSGLTYGAGYVRREPRHLQRDMHALICPQEIVD